MVYTAAVCFNLLPLWCCFGAQASGDDERDALEFSNRAAHWELQVNLALQAKNTTWCVACSSLV